MQQDPELEVKRDRFSVFDKAIKAFGLSIWGRCKDQNSKSGHDFKQGPIFIKDEASKTHMAISQCSYCGKVLQSEFVVELPKMPHEMMPPASFPQIN